MHIPFYTIFKYHVPYKENSNYMNITIQTVLETYFDVYFYDDFSIIVDDGNGNLMNYYLI